MYQQQKTPQQQVHKIRVIPSHGTTKSLLLNNRDSHCPLSTREVTEFDQVRHDAYLLRNEIYLG